MADKDIKLNLTAVDKASEKIKGVNNEIDELGNNTKQQSQKMQMRWTELWSKVQLGVAAFQQVYQAAEQFYQLAREGAELEYTASKFDRLTESIDTTTEALMVDLKEATDGTMSEMALMASATDFMTLGLAKSHDEVVRLTTVSSQLGMDMNQLVLTLTNQTTMRFDALGVAVDGFDEKVKALKDSGMDTNEAFTEAFLQQAEEQIAKVGSVTDESIGSFMRLEAAWQDIVAEGKKNLVPVVADIAEGLAEMMTLIPDNEDALYNLNQELMSGKITHDEYKAAVDNMLDSLHISIDEHGNLESNMRGAEDATAALSDKTGLYSEAAYYAALQTQLWKADANAATTAIDDQTEAVDELKEAQLRLKESQTEYKLFLSGELGKENEKYIEDLENLTLQSSDLREEIGELGKLEHRTKEQEEELQGLIGDLEGVRSKIEEVKNEHDEQTKQILLNLIEQRLGIDGITAAEQDFLLDLAGNWGLVDEATVKAWEKIGTYIEGVDDATLASEDFLAVVSNIPKELTINVHARFINDVPSWVWNNTNPTMGGGGSGGAGQAGGGFEAKAAGGDIRPGGSAIVGEHGIEHLRVGYDGTVTVTPVTNNYNHFNLGVTTMQSLDTVTTGFAILQAMQ